MQHVDEGQLHAYLDGELTEPGDDPREVERHLAGCAECQALLDGVKLLRERGRSLLADPLPVAAPPFEEVIARANRPAPKAGWLPRRAATLAWAASIMVALGAGWLARDLLRREEAPRAEMAASLPESAAPAPVADTSEPEILAAAPQESAAPAPSAVPAAKTGSDLGATVEPSLAMSAPTAPPMPGGTVGMENSTVRIRGVSRAPGDGAAADRAEVVAMADPPPPPPPPPPMAEQRVAAPASEPVTVAAPRASRSTPAQAFAADDAGWAAVERATAEERLGAPLATVPALRVLGIELSTAGSSPVVRVRQQLPGGQVLVLLAQRVATAGAREPVQVQARAAGVAAGVEASQASAVTVAARRVGALVLTATAPIPTDSLTALLAKAR